MRKRQRDGTLETVVKCDAEAFSAAWDYLADSDKEFCRPRKRGEKRSFLGRLDFFRPLAHAGGCTEKKKRSSTQKMTKISKIPSLLASDTAKGPCNITDFTYVLEEVFVSQS